MLLPPHTACSPACPTCVMDRLGDVGRAVRGQMPEIGDPWVAAVLLVLGVPEPVQRADASGAMVGADSSGALDVADVGRARCLPGLTENEPGLLAAAVANLVLRESVRLKTRFAFCGDGKAHVPGLARAPGPTPRFPLRPGAGVVASDRLQRRRGLECGRLGRRGI